MRGDKLLSIKNLARRIVAITQKKLGTGGKTPSLFGGGIKKQTCFQGLVRAIENLKLGMGGFP